MDDPLVAGIALLLGLLLAATGLGLVARRLRIPDPILLVVGGLALALVPDLPRLELEPDIVFLLFLPPILYAAGYFTSIREFKANLRAILLLSIGLVLFTTVVVAVTVRLLDPSLAWPVAFALGAIVSPPDAVAATAIFQRLGVPRQVVTVLEGESLVNDATALVALNTAIAASVAGSAFSVPSAAGDFVAVALGGVAIGTAAGIVVGRVLARIDDPTLGIVLTLLVPALVFLPAELVGVSGVLAVVTAGLIAGRQSTWTLSSAQRVQGQAAWSTALFVINGLVFILIGLQLPTVIEGLGEYAPAQLATLAAGSILAAILARLVWVPVASGVARLVAAGLGRPDPYPEPRNVAVVAWAGMRGVVSLAAALALPESFPDREIVLFLTFCVILATLVVQGLTLPLVIRLLRVTSDGDGDAEERTARLHAAEAAVDEIERLRRVWPDHLELIDQLRAQYDHRVRHIDPGGDGPRDEHERELLEHRIIRREVIDAERAAVVALRDRGVIGDQALRRIERDLDLEELRLEA